MIELNHITKIYKTGNVLAVDDVSFKLPERGLVSILGESGSGKTTLLNIIGGLDAYTSGDLYIDGVSTKHFKETDWDAYRAKYIGFIFQNKNLIEHLSVYENLELALIINNKKGKKDDLIKKACGIVRLPESLLSKTPSHLSGGEVQRVEIARAIINDPQIIIADEPTASLDDVNSIQVMAILKELSKTKLVVMVTHNKGLARDYSDRIIRIGSGRIIEDKLLPGAKKQEFVEYDKDGKFKAKTYGVSPFSLFLLACKNLFAKRVVSLFKIVASFIAVVGITLVLSLSAGFNSEIRALEQLNNAEIQRIEVESSKKYPLELDTNVKLRNTKGGYIYSQKGKNLTRPENIIDASTMAFVDGIDPNLYLSMQKLSGIQMNIVSSIGYVDQEDLNWQEIADMKFIMGDANDSENYPGYYELIEGEMPQSPTDVLLILNESNVIPFSVINYYASSDIEEKPKDLLISMNKTPLKLIYNSDFYVKTATGEFGGIYEMQFNEDLQKLYYYGEGDPRGDKEPFIPLDTINVCGILKLKDNAGIAPLDTGLAYTSALAEYVTLIESGQQEMYYCSTCNRYFKDASHEHGLTLQTIPKSPVCIAQEGSTRDVRRLGEDGKEVMFLAGELSLARKQLGCDTVPQAVKIYPSGVESKDALMLILNDYSEKSGVMYDYQNPDEDLIKTLADIGSLKDVANGIISILSIFAAIIAVISLIIIAALTYNSIEERTREIGTMRCIGAKRRDVRRIFNSENAIVGLFAGIIGVVVALITMLIVNTSNITLVEGIRTVAATDPIVMIVMVAASAITSVLAGLIPAIIAARKAPVEALRQK